MQVLGRALACDSPGPTGLSRDLSGGGSPTAAIRTPPLTLHECRHTYAAFMIAAGVSAKALQAYMGHASITVTLDRYGHLLPGAEAEAAGLLGAYLERESRDSQNPPGALHPARARRGSQNPGRSQRRSRALSEALHGRGLSAGLQNRRFQVRALGAPLALERAIPLAMGACGRFRARHELAFNAAQDRSGRDLPAPPRGTTAAELLAPGGDSPGRLAALTREQVERLAAESRRRTTSSLRRALQRVSRRPPGAASPRWSPGPFPSSIPASMTPDIVTSLGLIGCPVGTGCGGSGEYPVLIGEKDARRPPGAVASWRMRWAGGSRAYFR